MTLRSSDLQSDSDLDSIRNSCDVFYLIGSSFSRLILIFIHWFSFLYIGSSFHRWVLLFLDWCTSGMCCPRVGTRRVQVPNQVNRCTFGMCCPRIGDAGTGGWAL